MNKIPKIIHYCWFGRNPLPKDAQKCIDSWRKYFPDYEIIEWNEDNFDVNALPYTAEAYAAKKYAFVSDYARFKILYEYGGIYFDTDVEVIKPFDDILAKGSFMGFEINANDNGFKGLVAPGLGLGVNCQHKIYADLIEFYSSIRFFNHDGSFNQKTVVEYMTNILIKNGLTDNKGIQKIDDIYIYPSEYFNPFDDATGRLHITSFTHSIHWFSKSWIEGRSKLYTYLSRVLHRAIGINASLRIRKILGL